MITYKDLQEKGICWTGYKRKKGTKPYEDNSCMKEELEKHHVLAFGRMNPITSGHEAVVNKLHSVAKEHGASHSLVVSHSQDAKKNPLTGEQKVAHAKNAFPGTKVSSASKESPTILHHAAAAYAAGATHLHVIAGSDRHEEMHNLLHKYNGQKAAHGHYNFKSITVHSSGERDPDAEGTTGISASKMREHAASGNKTEFHKGAPSKMKPEHKDAMYNDVRKGMNIKEETVQETLRPEMGAAHYIDDFIKSTNPRFNNKSKEERRKMAIGAYMAAKAKGVKEEVQIDEVSAKLAGNYYGAATKKHLDKVGMKPNMYGRIEKDMGKNRKAGVDRALDRVTGARKTNEEVQIDELSTDLLARYKTASAASAKAADASGNYAKGDKRFKGINKATTKQFDNDLKKHGQMKEGTLQGNIGGGDAMNTTTSAPSASTSKDTTMSKKIKGFKFFNGENDKQMNMNQPVKEEKKDDVPFDGPYKSTFKKPNNPNRTGMDAARSLAQRAMDQLNTKKKEDIKEGERGLWDNIHAKRKRIENGSGEKMRKPGSKGAPTADALKAAAESFEYNFDMLEEAVKSIDTGEYDYEGQMARTQLQTILRNSTDLIGMLSDDDNMPEWVQSKITLAQDYISTVRDYLQSKEELGEAYRSYSGRSHGHAYGGGGFGKREREDDEYHVPDPTPVAPTIARKYIKGTPENKAAKAASKPINGHPTNKTNEEIEPIEEKSVQARRNKTYKNLMAASKGARVNKELGMTPADTGHKNNQQMNKAIGRAVNRGEVFEASTGNPGNGYHGQHKTEHDADEAYKKIHAHVKSLTDSDDKTVKHYLDSAHGRHLVGHENDHDHIKKDFKKFSKYYKPEMHEATAQKGVNVDKVNHAGDIPHEEKWEEAPKTVSKLKKVKEDNMKSYKEFLQSLDEKLIGKQHKIDKNKNGKVDKNDFELLRKEEVELDESTYADAEKAKSVADALKQKHNDGNYSVKQTKNGHKVVHAYHGDTKVKNQCKSMNEELEQIDEIKMADVPSRMIKGKSYGADYEDPEGAFETKKDMKKPEKAGRKAGAGAGVYKPRKTMSKLKAAGSTYK